MQKNVLCAYVDCHEGDSPLGVFKVSRSTQRTALLLLLLLLLKLFVSHKIMNNLEFHVQPHPATELKGGTCLAKGSGKPLAGKKAGVKRKKGKELSAAKKPR